MKQQIVGISGIARQWLRRPTRFQLPQGADGVMGLQFQIKSVNSPMRAPKIYFGAGTAGQNTEAFVLSLPSMAATQALNNFSASAGALDKVYFALPKAYGFISAYIGNIPGWFAAPTDISVTDPSTGYTEAYSLYESISLNLGSVTVFTE